MKEALAKPEKSQTTLSELALLFLRLGFTAFGGPAAHIAIMENEIVRRRHWLSSERFLDLLGVANLIPGPSSTELAIFIGYEQAGWLGLGLAGVCFILPAAVIVTALAWAYVRYGSLPQVTGTLYGIKPVVIAVVFQALWGLAPKAVRRSLWLAGLGVAACGASALNVPAFDVLMGAGFACVAKRQLVQPEVNAKALIVGGVMGIGTGAAIPVTLAGIFVAFLKVGALVFGSGYVLLAFLREDLVDRLHWLTEQQLLDAVAIGQVTPGPVFTTATFIGYLLGGGWGAVLATIGIFLPGFLLVAASRLLVARLRQSPTASAFLDGVNVAALSLMAVVAVELGRTALVDWTTVAVAVGSAALLIRFRVNTTWLVLCGAAVGAIAKSVGGSR